MTGCEAWAGLEKGFENSLKKAGLPAGRKVIPPLGKVFPHDDWDEIIKSHKYSRKEFRNGAWRYYYDKHNNFSRMTRCKSQTLKVRGKLSNRDIVRIGENYLKNVWIADWRNHPEKSVCKELKGKTINFDTISYEHISKVGRNSAAKNKQRDKKNLLNHVKYLPCAKELLENNGVHTQSRYQRFDIPQKDGAVGIVYQTVSGLAPKGDENKYVHVTVSQKKFRDGRYGNTVYISVVGTRDIKKSLLDDRDFDDFSARLIGDQKISYTGLFSQNENPVPTAKETEEKLPSHKGDISPSRRGRIISTDKIVNKNIKKSTVCPCLSVGRSEGESSKAASQNGRHRNPSRGKAGCRLPAKKLSCGRAGTSSPTSAGTPCVDTVNINKNPVFCNKNIRKTIEIEIKDVTEGNRAAKFAELEKCLTGGVPSYVAPDGTRKLGDIHISLADLGAERVEKALRTVAFSLDVPLKAAKGEAFAFKAQEDLVERWMRFFSDVTRGTYNFILEFFGLPEITVMRKADVLTHKGAVLYSPETGEPIKQKDWDRFVKNLEDFLNRGLKDAGKRIVLGGRALGVILDRMLKYNTLEAVKQARLSGLAYRGKTFDWISEEVKRFASVTGEPVTRAEAARIEVMRQSAAQRITNMSGAMKADVQQILIDGVKNRQSKTQVSQALFDRFVGYNRNFQRIADTEIQNAVNRAVLLEETNSAPEGEKVYFQRMEIIDDNTCEFCKRMNGKIAVWSGVPLPDERVKDEYADFAIWDGKEWDGKKNIAATGAFHPYCRGMWVRWRPEGRAANAFTAEIFRRGRKWKEAVTRAKEEFRAKGVENPDDRTAGFTERIQELFDGEGGIRKSSNGWENQPRAGNGPRFAVKTAGRYRKV